MTLSVRSACQSRYLCFEEWILTCTRDLRYICVISVCMHDVVTG